LQAAFNYDKEKEQLLEQPIYQHDKVVSFKDKEEREPFFETLLYSLLILIFIDTITTTTLDHERKRKQ